MPRPANMENRFRFLFDTWYGALALWGGACVVFLAFQAFDVFLPGRLPRALNVCLGRTFFGLALLSGILFFVAWVVSLARRRWRRALLQAFLGLGLLVWVLCAFFAILIAADLGTSLCSKGSRWMQGSVFRVSKCWGNMAITCTPRNPPKGRQNPTTSRPSP